jgi:hypothetical protein
LPLKIQTPIELIARVKLDMFYYLTYLSPLVILLFLFSWIIKPSLNWGWNIKFGKTFSNIPIKSTKQAKNLLTASIIVSIISAYYPYLPTINPQNLLLGIDTAWYVNNTQIIEKDISQAFNVSGGSRPTIYLFIISLKKITGLDTTLIVKFLPAILNPLLIYSIYFFTYMISLDDNFASWAAFFTACGYQITVNMYAFFLTNMLGLTLLFFSLGYLFKTLHENDRTSLIAASLIGSLIVFTHPWTLSQYFASVITLTLSVFYRYYKDRKEYTFLKPLMIYISVIALTELVKIQLFQGVGGLAASSYAVKSFIGLLGFWAHSIFSFQFLYGGLTSNLPLIALATAGAFYFDNNEPSERFLSILVALTSIVFLVGSETIKSRLFFNLPIGFLAASGFLHITKRIEGGNFRKYFIFFTVTNMLTYLFRSLAMIVILSGY